MKVRDRLLQFEEEKKSHNFFVTFVVFILLCLIVGVLYYYREPINNKLEIVKNDNNDNDESNSNNDNSKTLEEFKKYDTESGLYIPSVPSGGAIFYAKNEDIILKMTNIEGDKTGYTIDLTFEQEYGDIRNAKVNKVYIDGYDTSVKSFNVNLKTGYIDKHTIHINKTELDELELNDFDTITLNMTIDQIGKQSMNRYFDLETEQILAANNKEKDLFRVATLDKIQINFYKKVVDNDNTYLYFLMKDTSLITDIDYRVSDVIINKLMINNSVYEIEDSCSVYGYSKKMFVISIPRDNVNSVDQLSVSFIVSENINNNFIGYYFSNQVNVDVN